MNNSTSLRRGLLWRLLPSMLLLLVIGGAEAYLLARHYANTVFDSWLYDSAKSLTVVLHRGDSGVTVDLPESSRELFIWDVTDTTYFKVRGSRSGLLIGTPDIPPPPENAEPHQEAVIFDAIVNDRPVRVAALTLPAERFGETIQIEVAETDRKRNVMARNILLSLIVPQGMLFALAAILIWNGVGRTLEPLGVIAQKLNRQEQLRQLPVLKSEVPQEIWPLTQALDRLLKRLDKSLAAQRKFITDAAHQLRTPLAALKLNIEQAQNESDSAQLQRILAELRVSAERAIRLSNQMLALARADPEAILTQSFKTIDLCDFVRSVGAEWVPTALKKDIDLGFVSDCAKADVVASPPLLREALNNLIDNAIKYHPGRGSITLTVTGAPRAAITVDDDGPGIPEQERSRVMERFYRMDHTPGGGAGLGLAIVREIAEAHRAEVEICTGSSGRGTQVRFLFPVRPAPNDATTLV